MILHAYTIYDLKAFQYHAPFFAVADGAAVRMFSDLVNDPNTNVARHPADYVLYRCGSYDDEHGQLHPLSPLVHMVDAIALVERKSPLPFDPKPRDATGAAGHAASSPEQTEVKFNGSGV